MNSRSQKAAKEARLKAVKEDLHKTAADLQKNRDNITKIEERIHECSKLVRASRYVPTYAGSHVHRHDVTSTSVWASLLVNPYEQLLQSYVQAIRNLHYIVFAVCVQPGKGSIPLTLIWKE